MILSRFSEFRRAEPHGAGSSPTRPCGTRPSDRCPPLGLGFSRTLLLLLWFLSLNVAPIQAHQASDSYLTLRLSEAGVSGRWDIAIRDLDFALDLDSNRDGVITWGELEQGRTQMESYVFSKLKLSMDGKAVVAERTGLKVEKYGDEWHAVFEFTGHPTLEPSGTKYIIGKARLREKGCLIRTSRKFCDA